jgi:hypothetical protein
VSTVRSLIVAMATTGLVLGAEAIAAGQEMGTAQAANLRVQWELEAGRGAWRNFCGRVYNDREVPARHVVILFEGFDGAGQQVSRRFGEVIGDVPASGYSIFCLMVPAKGTTYRVTVPAVEWGFSTGGQ